jgi:hypothetical protein
MLHRAELLIDIFKTSYDHFGKFNKAGDKRGIRNAKIPPRVMHLAVLLCTQLGVSNYEKHRKEAAPHLRAYSTLAKYLRKADQTSGFHEEYLTAARLHAGSRSFPKNSRECMALLMDECIIIRSCHYSVSRNEVTGFTDNVTIPEISSLLVKEMLLQALPPPFPNAAPQAAAAAVVAPAAAPVQTQNKVWLKVSSGKAFIGVTFSDHINALEIDVAHSHFLRIETITPDSYAAKNLKLKIGDMICGIEQRHPETFQLQKNSTLSAARGSNLG